MLTCANTVLLVVDVQGKLAHLMHEKKALFENLRTVIKGAQILDLPIIVTEQNPTRLGATIPEIVPLLEGVTPLPKLTFSCCGDEHFMRELQALGRKQILIAGIETHICVYQTTVQLLQHGYEVQVLADSVSSRAPLNKQIGLDRMQEAGARLTTVEMALYELLQVAEGEQFKQVLKIVR